MTLWTLVAEGDLSNFKDTGTAFSPIVAPTPTTLFDIDGISLVAIDDTNYNRSYSVLRSPVNAAIERIEIEFSGTRNSPNRAAGGNASHIYVALATAIPEPAEDAMLLAGVCGLLVLSARRRRAASASRP